MQLTWPDKRAPSLHKDTCTKVPRNSPWYEFLWISTAFAELGLQYLKQRVSWCAGNASILRFIDRFSKKSRV
jgi:hypothetical protein